MSPFLSPRLFAGRGRVSGLGERPHLFNYAPVLQMTMCFGRTVVRLQTVRLLAPAPHPVSPRKEAGRGEYPIILIDATD